jgi:SAM-dependent methyltransferase
MATEQQDLHGPAGTDDWRAAGAAWGSSANDWSCLYEHYSIDVLMALCSRLVVGPTRRLLDIACGSGLAVRLADAMGATVAGIDASTDLVAVARERTPAADLRVGSMFELPWADQSFDAAVSVNGIWGGCEAALHEAFRVLRPGGLVGISFWGAGPPLDLRACFKVFANHSPQHHLKSMRQLNSISAPGIPEAMLTAAGFVVTEHERRTSVIEWPDAELAWRALSSIGPAVPALRHGDHDVIKRDLLDALEPCRDTRGIYRLRNDHHFMIAGKPTRSHGA